MAVPDLYTQRCSRSCAVWLKHTHSHTHTHKGLRQSSLGSWRMYNGVLDVNNLSNVRKMLVNRSMKARAVDWPQLSPSVQLTDVLT